MDRLNPLDAVFVDAEDADRHTSMAIASIAVFEGPAPSQEEVLAYLAGRLPLVPRYRQKLRTVPFRLGRPVWVDDPDFDLRYHVRRTALPAPGGDRELAELMARVMSQRLDRDHPLWEYWLVEGLAEGRWALISKVHHCMVDGVSGTDLYRVIFDFSPEPAPPCGRPWPATGTCAPSPPPWNWPPGPRGRGRAPGPGGRRAEPAPRPIPAVAVRQAADTARALAKLAPAAVAGHGIVAERAHRPAAALHLGPGVAGRRQDDQGAARRHRERRRPGRDQRRLPRPPARPRRAARTAHGPLAGPGVGPGSRRRRTSTRTRSRRSWPISPSTSPTRWSGSPPSRPSWGR